MKRVLKYTLVMFLAMFSFNLTAFAKETVIKIDSENEFIKVGETVELNVNIDTEEKISEVTFEVESSDNIEIKAVTLGSSKYTKEETENKYNINFNDDLTGTNNIFDILIKANSFGDTGSGLVTIKNISYKKESKTVKLNDVTYSIDVQSNKIENIEDGKTDSEKERIAISNANVLVEAAERSNSKDDYESALAYVNTLTNETDGCVGAALIISMVISSLIGTLTPIIFDKVNIDPAVASGPLITTVNDLVAVVTYYGLAGIFLIEIMHL